MEPIKLNKISHICIPKALLFKIVIELDDKADYTGSIILFEESAQNGSRINELIIPVNV